MVNEHTSAAIAQLVFFVPALIYASYIGVRAWKYGPKLAWYLVIVFCLIRTAGAGVAIAYQQDLHNVGLIVTAYVLLNIGMVPLLTALNRLLRLVSAGNFPKNMALRRIHLLCTYLILAAAGLLGAAGGKVGQPDQAALQKTMFEVAYFEFLGVFVILVLLCMYLYFVRRHELREDHVMYLKWLLIACPFIAVRAAYGIIGVFEATGDKLTTSPWSPLFGNAAAFCLMALLPEFVALCIFMRLGHYRIATCSRPGWVDDRQPSVPFLQRFRLGRKLKPVNSEEDHMKLSSQPRYSNVGRHGESRRGESAV